MKHDVVSGLGCLRNENMLALRLNPERHMTPNAAAATSNFLEYANEIVTMQMPDYFYAAWAACRLVPANKFAPIRATARGHS